MFKLLRVNDDWFVIIKDNKNAFSGNLLKTVGAMVELGVELDEVQYSLTTLIDNKHDVADFGINKTMNYSERLAA
jgi:hypothetical protein